ncbi:MAG: hypothetical protein AAF519_02550 [Bacteroidota bacterium]
MKVTKKTLLRFLLPLAFVLACDTKKELMDFDYTTWVADPNGCSGKRLALQSSLENNLESLKTLNQNEVKELLGKPDKNELYTRSQKFFIYQIGPGEECGSSLTTPSPYLSIRFNAMGLAKEVLIYTR